MADSDEETEQAPTPDAALYEATLDTEFLTAYNSCESSSQIQHQQPYIPVRRGTRFDNALRTSVPIVQ
ncbi:unnamed protein product [Alternaria alternata]